MRALLLASAAALLLTAPAFAEGPTGFSGNNFGHFAGYNHLCGAAGCVQTSMRSRVPRPHYDIDGNLSCRFQVTGFCAFIWSGMEDINANLAQAGVGVYDDQAGTFAFHAFWECYPANNVQTTFDGGATLDLNPGDVWETSVQCTNCTAGQPLPGTLSWTYTVTDVTKGQSVSKSNYTSCPMTDDQLWNSFWVIETAPADNVNLGVLPFIEVKENNAYVNIVQSLQMTCTDAATKPCARYEYTTGMGNTGATYNPSVPGADAHSFNLCAQTNGQGNSGGTANFSPCGNDVLARFNPAAGGGL